MPQQQKFHTDGVTKQYYYIINPVVMGFHYICKFVRFYNNYSPSPFVVKFCVLLQKMPLLKKKIYSMNLLTVLL